MTTLEEIVGRLESLDQESLTELWRYIDYLKWKQGPGPAQATGQPLQLALYSADGPLHTGKYFWSSDVGDWNAEGRPTLTVVWGEPCYAPTVVCSLLHLPFIKR